MAPDGSPMLPLTPPQTVGPFFAVLVPGRGTLRLTAGARSSRSVVVDSVVRDGAGRPVPDALIEIWQANAEGRYAHPEDGGPGDGTFTGFGRIHTTAEGTFGIETVMPGAVPDPDGGRQAPHLLVGVFARGLFARLVTRIYFDGEPLNDRDWVLGRVPPARRSTLVAARVSDHRYRFEIALQGPHETVFFDV